MIICNNLGCVSKYCCIECSNKHNYCVCEVAQELNCDEELILQKCEYAEDSEV